MFNTIHLPLARTALTTAVAVALLAACGGAGDSGHIEAQTLAQPASTERPQQLSSFGAREFFDWAQIKFPDLLAGSYTDFPLEYQGINFSVRSIPSKNAYLGLSATGDVVALAPFTNNALQNYGPLSGFRAQAQADLCAAGHPSCAPAATNVTKTLNYMAMTVENTSVAHTAEVCYPKNIAQGEKRPVVILLPGWDGASDVTPASSCDWSNSGYITMSIGFKKSKQFNWVSNIQQSVQEAISTLAADISIPADITVLALNGTSYGGTQSVLLARTMTAWKSNIRAILSEDAGYTWDGTNTNPATGGNAANDPRSIVPRDRPFAISLMQQLGDTTFRPTSCDFGNCGITNRAQAHFLAGGANAQRFYAHCPAGGEHGIRSNANEWATWRVSAMKYMLHTDYSASKHSGYIEPSAMPTNACN